MASKEVSKMSKAELVALVGKKDTALAETAAALTATEAKTATLKSTVVRGAWTHEHKSTMMSGL